MPKQTFFNLPNHKREHVIQCAVAEFSRQGYKQASISRIVADAGIAKGSFYQYFEDKDDLFIHIVASEIAPLKLGAYEREVDRLTEMNLSQYLRHVAKAQLKAFTEQPELFKISHELINLKSEPIYKKVMEGFENVSDTLFLPPIRHEIANGEIDGRVNPQMLNFMLTSIAQYQLYLYNAGEIAVFDEDLIDSVIDDLDFILTNGIYTENGKRS